MYVEPCDNAHCKKVSRRQLVGRLAVLAAGMAAAACTPARIVLKLYPDDFDEQPELTDKVLRAFVVTVIPGAPLNDPNLARAFYDRHYPFARFRNFLAADLCDRSQERFGTSCFDRLTLKQRSEVIQSGLAAGGTTARLYNGAIFLSQIAFYAGIYDDEKGCSLIEFDGRYRVREVAATSYPEARRYLAREITSDGNPV